MSAYYVITFNIINQDLYNKYIEKVFPLIQKHNGTLVVADFDPKEIEGTKKNANIILKFNSEEEALGWYNDPEYVEVRKIRWESTKDTYCVLVKEFTWG